MAFTLLDARCLSSGVKPGRLEAFGGWAVFAMALLQHHPGLYYNKAVSRSASPSLGTEDGMIHWRSGKFDRSDTVVVYIGTLIETIMNPL